MLVSASRRRQSHQILQEQGSYIIPLSIPHLELQPSSFSHSERLTAIHYTLPLIIPNAVPPPLRSSTSLQCPKTSANQRAANAAEAETSLFHKCARPSLLAQKGIDPRCSRPANKCLRHQVPAKVMTHFRRAHHSEMGHDPTFKPTLMQRYFLLVAWTIK